MLTEGKQKLEYQKMRIIIVYSKIQIQTNSILFFYEEDVQNARSLFSDDDLMEMYTAPSSGWISCAPMTAARSYMASVAVDNNIYVFGGKEGDTIVNKNELFNTSTELWTAKENMPYKRYGHEALYNEGYIYLQRIQ